MLASVYTWAIIQAPIVPGPQKLDENTQAIIWQTLTNHPCAHPLLFYTAFGEVNIV